jgi:Tfp pilus tip-associated adhesin PilY1
VFNDLPWDKNQLKTWTQQDMVEIINNIGDNNDNKTFFVDGTVNQQGGWYFNLDLQGSDTAWIGEKGLTTPVVIGKTVYFGTYVPPQTTKDLCQTFDEGQSWLYAFDLLSGDATTKLAERSQERSQEGDQKSKGGTKDKPLAIPGAPGTPTISPIVLSTGAGLLPKGGNPLITDPLKPNRIFWMQHE